MPPWAAEDLSPHGATSAQAETEEDQEEDNLKKTHGCQKEDRTGTLFNRLHRTRPLHQPMCHYPQEALNTSCSEYVAASLKWLSGKAFATQAPWLAKHCSAPGPKFTFLFCFSLSRAKRKDLARSPARFASASTVTHSTALHHNTFFQWDFILNGTCLQNLMLEKSKRCMNMGAKRRVEGNSGVGSQLVG